MDPLSAFIEKQGFVVLDGALATELERKGLNLNDPLWSAKALYEHPDLVFQTHLDYFTAGADVATTASYQATLDGFFKKGFSQNEAIALLQKSVELALAARETFWADRQNRQGRLRPLVAASIGPYGAYLADGSEYSGNYGLPDARLLEFHATRLEVLAASQADILAFETVPCLQEAAVLMELLARFPQKKAWLGFSCKNGRQISSGEPFAAAVRLASLSGQIAAVGANCTAPEFVSELLGIARSITQKPLLAYPNSGEKWDAAQHRWAGDNKPACWFGEAKNWLKTGAKLIGGCCRSTPGDIRELRKLLA
jgi:homocysteine S-methyltransferase